MRRSVPRTCDTREVRILGVDPGLTRCGLGLIRVGAGRKLRLVDVGVARTEAGQPMERRLLSISQEIDSWLERYEPDALAVERVYVGTNISTVTATAQVAGLAMVAAARSGIPVTLHTPTEMKATVTGYGGAPKTQVQEMVRRILSLAEAPTPADAADALALAITNAWRGSAATDDAGRTSSARTEGSTLTPAQKQWAQARERAQSNEKRALARLRRR